ncbi:MAG: isochorismatase family protein [Spirochaetales bacterium]|nr:isochorismatase family protein [Leptospiraceae bacterium]MCP5483139.1 isochorismatase family protein [Spirochaetales bacterium]MCP5484579.1 isochorismatase family protein [Spirochaetales bacterium]
MQRSILITQCLQNDFVQPLERYESMPNQLHVGYGEALRLMGERAEDGPVHLALRWAYEQPNDRLAIVHIRDWHDGSDPRQAAHLKQFGPHCLKGTPGADFVFRSLMRSDRSDEIVNASGLNDFVDTDLARVLAPHIKPGARVGLTGVWTEAKITFLAYELLTRYPELELAVCSALCASSSRSMHFVALEQLESILGVQVFSSVGAFTEFLTGSQPVVFEGSRSSRLNEGKLGLPAGYELVEADRNLVLYLFRDSKEVDLQVLDGGFSGNVVLRARSRDHFGHSQVPHVVKIGDRDQIARERTAFERIQEVMGNSAPSIVDFAEIGNRGGIKYRYAGMLDGNVRSFQKLYAGSDDEARLLRVLDTVFQKQLGRFYEVSSQENLDLLRYYDFSARYAPGVRRRVEDLIGHAAEGDWLEIVPGLRVPNVCRFYERDLEELSEPYSAPRYMAYVHGDLNGANILIDASENVWLIDFFHTHRGHILKDLIKLENDLFYIFTPIESEQELREACALTDHLLAHEDLGVPPAPDQAGRFRLPALQKAYRVCCHLRSFYPELVQADRDPYQLYTGIVRYAMHTLSFDESNEWQRRWALYAGSLAAHRIAAILRSVQRLRVDEIPLETKNDGASLGLTILPGRRDRKRVLEDDLRALHEMGYRNVVSLLTPDEYERYGVGNLKEGYRTHGFKFFEFPIPDQMAPEREGLDMLLEWIHDRLALNEKVVVHCVGGLGRSGTVAAAYLIRYSGLDPTAAMQRVRESRSKRAIESMDQEQFVMSLS